MNEQNHIFRPARAKDRKLAMQICSAVNGDGSAIFPNTPRGLRFLFQSYFSLNNELRFYVMHRIATSRTDTARKLLRTILQKDSSTLVRHEAAFALGGIANTRDFRLIRHSLLHDENSLVRHESAMALGVMGQRSAIQALRRGLGDTDQMVVDSCRAAIMLIEMSDLKKPR